MGPGNEKENRSIRKMRRPLTSVGAWRSLGLGQQRGRANRMGRKKMDERRAGCCNRRKRGYHYEEITTPPAERFRERWLKRLVPGCVNCAPEARGSHRRDLRILGRTFWPSLKKIHGWSRRCALGCMNSALRLDPARMRDHTT